MIPVLTYDLSARTQAPAQFSCELVLQNNQRVTLGPLDAAQFAAIAALIAADGHLFYESQTKELHKTKP